MRTFYLGTHKTYWLWSGQIPEDVPLFVSHRQLRIRQSYGRAIMPWALDSGGFTELQKYGKWTESPAEYVRAVAQYQDRIGGLVWATPQDWMCEEVVRHGGTVQGQRFVGTGLSVDEHIARTVDNFVELCSIWDPRRPNPFRPVLQGTGLADYLRCWDRYEAAGVDLGAYDLVGVGSVCRRQATDEIGAILAGLRDRDRRLPIHGFGVKTQGLKQYAELLSTADSLAWSYNARRNPPLPECSHSSCANCHRWALRWRSRALEVAA